MLVNLTDVFTSEGKVVEKTIPLEMTEFHSNAGDFQITDKSTVQLKMSNLGVGKALAEGTVSVTLQMACDRCLEDVSVAMDLEFQRELSSTDVQDSAIDDENQDVVENGQLNIETLINNEILINLPDKVLCKENCKGICQLL